MIVGLDVHKKETVAFVVRESLQSGVWHRVPTTSEGLVSLLPIVQDLTVIVEASTSGKAVAKWLRNQNVRAKMLAADVLQAHMRRAKSDRLDARDLARIGLLGDARECYIPTAREEEMRALVRHLRDTREKIVELKNQIKAIAQRNLLPEPMGNLDNPHVRRRWSTLPVAPLESRALNGKLRLLENALREYDDALVELCYFTKEDETVHLLMGIKGVDVYTASTIVAHCGDFSRFPSGKQIASYAGLTPRLNQSGTNERHGRITKTGPNQLRHALIESAHNVVRHAGRLKSKYDRLKQRTGSGRAIVAIARTLMVTIWRMTTTKTAYYDLNDQHAAAKVWRLKQVARLHETGDHEKARHILNVTDPTRLHKAWAAGRSRILS